jgi:hypothetical protein
MITPNSNHLNITLDNMPLYDAPVVNNASSFLSCTTNGGKIKEGNSPKGTLWKISNYLVSSSLRTFSKESYYLLLAVKDIFLGLKNNFHIYNLNPKILTKKQAKRSPTLLIHGGFHNQGIWSSLAKEIDLFNRQQKNPLGPIYTINLKVCTSFTSENMRRLQNKIAEIYEVYVKQGRKNPPINLVGYCAGIHQALNMIFHKGFFHKETQEMLKKVGKIICIASNIFIDPYVFTIRKKMHIIQGSKDILFPLVELPQFCSSTIINSGHIGIMYSNDTHKKIIEILNN